jgi:hypothetical protein
MVLPFKDSEGGTCSYSILIGVTSAGTRQRKSKRSMLIAPRHLPLSKISVPPLARPLNPVAPGSALSNCRIPLAGLRRGLARTISEACPVAQHGPLDNHPAANVSWYDAVAFCQWLSVRSGHQVRLPTEWEWQQAATGGDPANKYPWGAEWDSRCANTNESSLNRTTAVGMYPHGASSVGALDLSGNVWEWCVKEYGAPERVGLTGTAPRAVRGGSLRWREFFSALGNVRPISSNHKPIPKQTDLPISGDRLQIRNPGPTNCTNDPFRNRL